MKKHKNTNRMAILLMVIFLFVFLVIAGRFIYIQATGEINNISLMDWANEKREAEVVLPAERGKIFDHNGKLLAYDRPTYRIYAVLNPELSKNKQEPMHVVDSDKTAKMLAPLLDMDEESIKNTINNGKKNELWQVEFGENGKNLSQKKMEEINSLKLPGINFMEDSIRYYSNGMFASHVIGFTRPDEKTEETVGVIGVESEYDQALKGSEGFIRYHRDKYNKKLLKANEIVKKPEHGKDIYLTIDQKIQTLLEDVMSEVDEKYEPKRMTAIVMNPKTGEILAMSNRPSFNPNQIDQVENWYNDGISTPFEPGSTAKIFTWAAAIEEGVYNGNEKFQSGKYKVNQKIETINDHNQGVGWGQISYDEGFRRSSNVAASKLVWEKIGTDTYLEYLKQFGLDEKTEIDLPNEVAGQILFNWPSEKLRSAFGQGSTITPIQQMKAATAVSNGGKMMRPYIVHKIVDPETDEIVKENKPEIVGEPISERTAAQMIELLDAVVNSDDGTGKSYRLHDYSVIGKTGTAQIPNPNGPGYLTGKQNYIFSFLGMAPKEDPQLMVYVSIMQPKLGPNELGSAPVSYIFKNVMENGLRYLNIEPDIDNHLKQVKMSNFPNLINKDTDKAVNQLNDMGVKPIIVGNGKKVATTNVEVGQPFLPNHNIIIITDKPTMPNIIGWSHRDVLSLANMLEIDIETTGTGFVSKQSIKEGTNMDKKLKLVVELAPPTPNKK